MKIRDWREKKAGLCRFFGDFMQLFYRIVVSLRMQNMS